MNTFGNIFKISIFGESHGNGIGIVVDGCPAGINISANDFTEDLARRKAGKKGTTPRKEDDLPELLSGVFNGKTTGAPIAILFRNNNTKSKDYSQLFDHPRPGHADFVARLKYGGYNDFTGGGHFSGRITLGLVAAGVIAKKMLAPMKFEANILEAGGMTDIDKAIEIAQEKKDSIGGIVECKITNIPVGLGEPFFGSVESAISSAVFSIPAVKGIEFGAGFKVAKMSGTENNDNIIDSKGTTETNNAGGINGGITNGNDIVFRIAVKPTPSVSLPQETFNIKDGKVEPLEIVGRHDLCIALRVPPVLEAAAAIALADLSLIAQSVKRVF
ncbi:MAG: chorismate synthase [Bacteroidales bacterium]|nr:chorismate synthase [Bacteroidales bacterium]